MTGFRLDTLPRWLYDIVPLVMWMALIFALSSWSRLIVIENEADEKIFYKMGHFLGYACLAWLWWRVLAPQRQMGWPVLLLAFALTTLYGVSDEIHQRFVPGRTGQLADVFFDAAGAWAMLLLLRRVKWLQIF